MRIISIIILSLLLALVAYASDLNQTSSRRVPASNRHYKDDKTVVTKPQLPPTKPVDKVAVVDTSEIKITVVKEDPKPVTDTPEVVEPKVVPENKATEIKPAAPSKPKESEESNFEKFNDREGSFPLDQPTGTDTREK